MTDGPYHFRSSTFRGLEGSRVGSVISRLSLSCLSSDDLAGGSPVRPFQGQLLPAIGHRPGYPQFPAHLVRRRTVRRPAKAICSLVRHFRGMTSPFPPGSAFPKDPRLALSGLLGHGHQPSTAVSPRRSGWLPFRTPIIAPTTGEQYCPSGLHCPRGRLHRTTGSRIGRRRTGTVSVRASHPLSRRRDRDAARLDGVGDK